MNNGYVFVPIFGLASFVGVIVGLLYFEWYERPNGSGAFDWRWSGRQLSPKRLPDPSQQRSASRIGCIPHLSQPLRPSTLPVDKNPERSGSSIIGFVIVIDNCTQSQSI